MIHAYFGVNLDVVWKTANERLPELKNEIEKILKEKNFKCIYTLQLKHFSITD